MDKRTVLIIRLSALFPVGALTDKGSPLSALSIIAKGESGVHDIEIEETD